MNATLLSIALLSLPAIVQAGTLPFPGVDTAKEKARETGQPSLILWHGSDWMGQSGDKLSEEWKDLADSKLPVVFGQFDEVTGSKVNRTQILPVEQFRLPVSILLAPDGTFMACYPASVTEKGSSVSRQVNALLPQLEQFQKLVQAARHQPGLDGARAAGQALELLDIQDAVQHKELKDIINKKDPENQTGYRALFATDHLGMYGTINTLMKGGTDGEKKGADRDFDAAETYVRQALQNKKLSGERLQQWLSGLAYITRERIKSSPGALEEKDLTPLVKLYQEIAAIAPKSQYGIGAARYAHYWDKSTFFVLKEGRYDGRYACRYEKDWHVDVSCQMAGAGRYSFKLIPIENSAMISRNFRLFINGKEVAQANQKPELNTKSVEFTVPTYSPGAKVEVWLTAKCLDNWMGPSGTFEMKKL